HRPREPARAELPRRGEIDLEQILLPGLERVAARAIGGAELERPVLPELVLVAEREPIAVRRHRGLRAIVALELVACAEAPLRGRVGDADPQPVARAVDVRELGPERSEAIVLNAKLELEPEAKRAGERHARAE